jgi:uncharacterized membrane protein
MLETIPVWVLLVPITLVFLAMALLLRYTATQVRGRAQLAGITMMVLIYAATNIGPIATAIRLGND